MLLFLIQLKTKKGRDELLDEIFKKIKLILFIS